MFFITVDQNVRCAVRDLNPRGQRCVLFVHGWPFDSSLYEWQYNILPSYGIRCISVDLRGFGDSDKPWSGYTYNRLADDLHRVISRLEVSCLVLCGFSLGASVCIRYMARHKGYKVSRLVLCGTAGPSFVQRPGYPYGMTREQVDGIIGNLYQDRFNVYESYAQQCLYQPGSPPFLQNVQNICARSSLPASIQTMESMRDEDLRGDLGKICVPCAILHGVQDQITPFPFAEELRSGIRDSFIIPFEDSGHFPFFEQKDAFNTALVDFINSAPLSR